MIVDTAIICILMGPFHTDYKVWGWMSIRSNGSDECVPQMCVCELTCVGVIVLATMMCVLMSAWVF